MPSKKKKYNARFPAGRIKKIMQTDEEVGKVALAVPIIISRTLELFVESLLKKAMQVTNAKNAKTLSPSHMKQCILSESRFDFLKELVEKIPDITASDDIYDPTIAKEEAHDLRLENSKISIVNSDVSNRSKANVHHRIENNGVQNANTGVDLRVRKNSTADIPHTSTGPNFYKELSQTSSPSSATVIQYSPKVSTTKPLSHSVNSIIGHTPAKVSRLSTENSSSDVKSIYHLDLSQTRYNASASGEDLSTSGKTPLFHLDLTKFNSETPPPLVPITDVQQMHPLYSSKFGSTNSNDDLDEDYDN